MVFYYYICLLSDVYCSSAIMRLCLIASFLASLMHSSRSPPRRYLLLIFIFFNILIHRYIHLHSLNFCFNANTLISFSLLFRRWLIAHFRRSFIFTSGFDLLIYLSWCHFYHDFRFTAMSRISYSAAICAWRCPTVNTVNIGAALATFACRLAAADLLADT